jgi:hypothetical protein
MGTTDSNGVWFWDENDIIAPIQTALNLGQSNLSGLVTELKDLGIHYVANTAARAALVATYAPSATRPLYVYRGDAPAGAKIEFSTNGTTWFSVYSSGRAAVTLSMSGDWTNFSGYPAPTLRVVGNRVFFDSTTLQIKGSATPPALTNGSVLTLLPANTVPAELRPSSAIRGYADMHGNTNAFVHGPFFVNTNGSVQAIAGGTLTMTGNSYIGLTTTSWLLPGS